MRRNPQLRAHLTALQPADRAVICPITRGEVLYGLERLPQGGRRRGLEAEAAHWFAQFPCLPIPETAGDHYARIKREAEVKGHRWMKTTSGWRRWRLPPVQFW